MSKLLIVIPAHNEEANIVQVVEELTRSYPQRQNRSALPCPRLSAH